MINDIREIDDFLKKHQITKIEIVSNGIEIDYFPEIESAKKQLEEYRIEDDGNFENWKKTKAEIDEKEKILENLEEINENKKEKTKTEIELENEIENLKLENKMWEDNNGEYPANDDAIRLHFINDLGEDDFEDFKD
jgi:seryl-tRNA synthetase